MKVWTLYKKEMKAFFRSPIAWVVILVFQIYTGIFFTMNFFENDVATISGIYSTIWFWLIYLIIIPSMTMRLMAVEKSVGTIEILTTYPVTDFQIVLSKYLAALSLYAIALAGTLIHVISAWSLVKTGASVDNGLILGTYLGFILLGAAFLSIGMVFSTIAKEQIVAFLLSFGVVAFFFMIFILLSLLPIEWTGIRWLFEFFSVIDRFFNMARGVVDLRDVTFYASVITLGLLLSKYFLESRKWK